MRTPKVQAALVAGASVEAHLDRVRRVPNAARRRDGRTNRSTEAWEAIRAHVETPRRSVVERLLGRIGVSTETSRLLAAVPAFGGAWLVGVVAVTVFAGIAALFSGESGLALFLIVAPLAPVAGVAASLRRRCRPGARAGTVTPYSALRLLLLRTAGVLATRCRHRGRRLRVAGPGLAGRRLADPGHGRRVLTLLLAPLLGSTAAAATLGACWSLAVVTRPGARSTTGVVEPAMQLVLAAWRWSPSRRSSSAHPSFEHLGGQS